MADFSTSVGGPAQAPYPVQPVQSNQTAQGITEVGGLASGLGDALIQANQAGYQRNLIIQKGVVSSAFEQQQLKLNDAVEQGQMTSLQARMQGRANLAQAIANNPMYVDELNKVHKDVMGTGGIAETAVNGTKEEQRNFDLIDQAQKAGVIPANASDDQALAIAQSYQGLQEKSYILSKNKEQVDYQAAQQSLSNSQQSGINLKLTAIKDRQDIANNVTTAQINKLNLATKQQEVAARANIPGMANDMLTIAQTRLAAVKAKFDASGKTPEDIAEATNALANDQAYMQHFITQPNADGSVPVAAGSDYVNAAMSPITSFYKAMDGYFKGTVRSDQLEQATKDSTNLAALQIVHNSPDIMTDLGLNKLFGSLNPDIALKMSTDAVKSIQTGAKPIPGLGVNGVLPSVPSGPQAVPTTSTSSPPSHGMALPPTVTDDGNKDAVSGYMSTIKSNLALWSTAGSIDATHKDQLSNAISKMALSVNKYGQNADPINLDAAVTALADPNMGKYIAQGGLKVDQGTTDNVSSIIKRNYVDKLVPLMREEYNRTTYVEPINPEYANPIATHRSNIDANTAKYVEPSFNGTALVWKPIDSNDPDAVFKAKQLNTDVSPVFNKIMRAVAHTSGQGTNYKSTYEELIKQVLPEVTDPKDPNYIPPIT